MEDVLGSPLTQPAFYDVERDEADQPLLDPVGPSRDRTKLLRKASSTRMPSIEVMVEF